MASERHVIIVGAGIAGLMAALALRRAGCRVSIFEQTPELQESGAGIQLSPNATRALIALGLYERLAPHVIAPQAIRVMAAASGREIVHIPLGDAIAHNYGAPYWAIHRGDLQAALASAAKAEPQIALRVGCYVENYTSDDESVSVRGRAIHGRVDERGDALIGADGIWSTVAEKLRCGPAMFAGRTAWRALVPAGQVTEEFRAPVINLWLGDDAHLVHYPVKAGRLINMVAIVRDEWREIGWSASAEREEILRRCGRASWCDKVRTLIGTPDQWLKWALYARGTPFDRGDGPVTLIGDAAHPMLPFLAQGAAMAIEDAAVLADSLHDNGDISGALRAYERARRRRTARAQRAASAQGRVYGLSGPQAFIRDLGMRLMGGDALLARQHWLYSWQTPKLLQNIAA